MKPFTYALEYRKKGLTGMKPIRIDFTCMDIVRRQSEIERDQFNFQKQYKEYVKKVNALRLIVDDPLKAEEAGRLTMQLMADQKILEDNVSFQNLFDRAVDNIILALEQNGITDEDLNTREFWDKCVDPNTVYELSAAIAGKDFDDKKKLPEEPIR